MITRIKRWLGCNGRAIFKYHDGIKTVYGDPVEIFISLVESEFGLKKNILEQLEINDLDAWKKVLPDLHAAFKVERFTDPCKPGLTESETFELFSRYMEYTAKLKKNGLFMPIMYRSLGEKAQATMALDGKNSQDSTSTEDESKTPEFQNLPPELEKHLRQVKQEASSNPPS